MKQIHRIAAELEKLDIDYNGRLWSMFTTGLDFGVDEASRKRTAFLKDKHLFAVICKHLEKELEPADRRGVEILHNLFKWHHVSAKANKIYGQIDKLQTELSDLLNKFRATLDGREVDSTEITRILSESPDRDLRRRAFLARAQVNGPLVEKGFLRLIELRKEYAAACRRTDFIALRLESDELQPSLFEGWDEELRKRKKDLRAKEKGVAQAVLGADDLMAWDYSYVKSLLCPDHNAKVDLTGFFAPIERTFKAYGWDIGGLNLTYDVFPRKNKSEWGYNFTIHPGKDSRILANVRDRFSHFNVLLHETAHGVHFLGLNPDERLLNMGVSGIVAEGFANFFGDLSYSREFLGEIFGRDMDSKLKDFDALVRFQNLMQFTHVSKTLFDHELYRADLRSNQDIMDLKRAMLKDHLGQDPFTDEVPWGFLIHHTVAPIYLHNYFLGDVMTASMKRVFKAQYGSNAEDSPKRFGRFWREKVLGPSGRYTFPELFERVCKEKLKLGPYLDRCLKVSIPKSRKYVLQEKGRLRDVDL